MSFFTPDRVEHEELLDEHDAPYDDMARSLRDLRNINRFLGGAPIYRRLMRRMWPDSSSPLSVLDLGTGTSDLPASLTSYRKVCSIGLDFKIDHLLYGRATSSDCVVRVVGDAFQLPFRTGSIDVVTSAHFFHHFSETENGVVIAESLRVSRTGVIINDTRRHHVPLALVRLLGKLRLVGRITKFDAEASVLRAYTLGEATKVASSTPARRWQILKAFPFRFAILLWK